MSKRALITGITGQDGAYLSKYLLTKGYEVKGIVRRLSENSLYGLTYLGIQEEIELIECDLTDFSQVVKILSSIRPDEIYNLAAQSSVSLSFQQPIGTINFNIISVLNLLETIRIVNPSIKFYQASSSEMFGKTVHLPISENSVIHPLSPYAISKASAHWTTINYREAYGLFTTCGILFNHESYLRSTNFFVKKVLQDSIRIKKNEKATLNVGNIEIKRDFGYAPKYVEAMWKMMSIDKPDDYIICSGVSVLLRDIILHIFKNLSIPEERLIVDKSLYRPTDIEDIYGAPYKAKVMLNWDYDLSFFEVLDLLLEEELENFNG